MQPIKKLESRFLSGDTLRMAPKILFPIQVQRSSTLHFQFCCCCCFAWVCFTPSLQKLCISTDDEWFVFQNSRHLFNQSYGQQNSIATCNWSSSFSCTWLWLSAYTSRSHWFIAFFLCVVMYPSLCFSFSFGFR